MGQFYGPQPPPMARNPYPQEDTVCYNCMPGGDVPRRSRRSADESEGRFIEIHDRNGKATLNNSFPIEIHIPNHNLTHKTELLSLRASLKQLRDHSRYEIVSGNEDHRFRIHHHAQESVLHFTKKTIDVDRSVVVGPLESSLRLRAMTTLSDDEIPRLSFESETIRDAIAESVQLDVNIYMEE